MRPVTVALNNNHQSLSANVNNGEFVDVISMSLCFFHTLSVADPAPVPFLTT